MLVLGGKLKFKEKISARLGDVLSNLYIASAMLKRYEDQGRPVADQPMLAWAFHDCVWRMQMALDGVLRNFPLRPVAWLLRALIFPLGRREVPPSDRLGRRVAAILCAPNETRDRLAGEVRAIGQAEARVREGAKLGFKRCILPETSRRQLPPIDGVELRGVQSLNDAWEILF